MPQIKQMMNPNAGMEKVPAYHTWVNAQVPQATTYLFSGPTSGSNGVASTAFTVALKGNNEIPQRVIITPADASDGAFSKATIMLDNSQPSTTFTYTPGSTGAKVISLTNNGGLTDPASITYTSS